MCVFLYTIWILSFPFHIAIEGIFSCDWVGNAECTARVIFLWESLIVEISEILEFSEIFTKIWKFSIFRPSFSAYF